MIDAKDQLEIVLNAIDELSQQASSLPKAEEGKAGDMNMEEVNSLLKELREYIEDDDTDALSVLEKLRPMIADEKLSDHLNNVEDALNGYDFDEALEHLSEIENGLGRQ